MVMKVKEKKEKNLKKQKQKPVYRIVENIRQIDEKIETNFSEFIDWIEEEKRKVYEKME
jgi:hypothetical protein